MEIKVKSWGNNKEFYDVSVHYGNGMFKEDMLSQQEVGNMAVSFMEDTVLNNCWQEETIERLIKVGLISQEMVLEYAKEIPE